MSRGKFLFSHKFFVPHHVASVSLGDPEFDLSDKVQPINHFVQCGVIRERIDYGNGCLFRCHSLTVEYCQVTDEVSRVRVTCRVSLHNAKISGRFSESAAF